MKYVASARESARVVVSLAVMLLCLATLFASEVRGPRSEAADFPSDIGPRTSDSEDQRGGATDRQQPPVTFRLEVNYVEVDANVVDRQGSFVNDLKKDDFEVYEDGKLQKVDAFALVSIPIEHAEKPLFVRQPIEPDVQTNARGMDGRLYLLVLDDLHTAATRTGQVRAAARKFVQDNLGANDLAAIVTTSGQGEGGQEFTNNRALLLQAIDRFVGQKLRSPTVEKLEEYARMYELGQQNDVLTDPTEVQRVYNARRLLQGVRDLSDFLAGVHGRRKALVLFSEGIDYNIGDPINNKYATDIREYVREMVSAATRSNVNVYTVDPRGLTDMSEEMMQVSGLPEDPSLGVSPQAFAAELRVSQDSLHIMADETGGFSVTNTNDFKSAFTRIVDDNSSYYVLGYYTSNERRDGRFRKIEVKVNRPGVQVRARKGYVAPTGKAPARRPIEFAAIKSPAVRDLLESPVPMSGFGLAVTAAPFKGTPQNASVVITVQASGSDLKFVEKEGRFNETVDLSILAINREGKVAGGDHQGLNLALKPETRSMIEQGGLRFVSRLNLPPGRYQLRVAAQDSQAGRVGSVYSDVIVPDFFKAPLSMSGLVLSSRAAGITATPRPDEELRKALPSPPTTVRDFLGNDELSLLAEIYDTQGATPHKVNITTRIFAEDGRTVFQHADERSSTELGGKSGGYGYSTRIPLADIPSGLYVLRVDATSTLGRNQTTRRELQFTVRGK